MGQQLEPTVGDNHAAGYKIITCFDFIGYKNDSERLRRRKTAVFRPERTDFGENFALSDP